MSDLAATNCGCGEVSNNGCNSIIWIIILLSCCGSGSGVFGGGSDCGNNNSCLWIILLLFCCGNNRSDGFGFGCGC